MFQIVEKKCIAPGVTFVVIEAPLIAKKRKPGQFVILRLYEQGERIPLTIVDADSSEGTITVISQRVGKSTAYLEDMPATHGILDVVGPLGNPTHIDNFGRVICIGGGIGIAPIYPIAQAMKEAGNEVIAILGGRSKEYVILENWMRAITDTVYIATDDGSYGIKGFVSDVLKERYILGERFDQAVAIGPVPMMKALADITKQYKTPLIVSLNPIMVDGTGMCGGCRVTVGGSTKFTCVDGPEFDGHQVDFDELIRRLKIFDNQNMQAMIRYKSAKTNNVEKEERTYHGSC